MSVVKGTRGGVQHGHWNQVFLVESSTTYCDVFKNIIHLFIWLWDQEGHSGETHLPTCSVSVGTKGTQSPTVRLVPEALQSLGQDRCGECPGTTADTEVQREQVPPRAPAACTPGSARGGPPAHPARVSPAGSMRWILQTFRKHSPL